MSAMQFDSVMVGSRIMKLRKAAGMTQMQLAETMGVSFQAVSNWERGMSCPDIARLTELAALLGVSVDEILGSKKAARVAEAIAKDEEIPAMSAEEMVEIAPVLTQDTRGDKIDLFIVSHFNRRVTFNICQFILRLIVLKNIYRSALFYHTGNLGKILICLCY